MTTTKLNDHATMPDDPADACRLISQMLHPLTDFARPELPGQFAELVMVLSDQEQNEAEAWERSRCALGLFARKAKDEAEAHIAALEPALSLARHGSGDYREMDRRIAAGLPASTGPTVAEVKAAQQVLAAYGDDDSEEASLRVLGSMEGDDAEQAS